MTYILPVKMDTSFIILLITVIILAGCTVYLNMRLVRKNMIINDIIKQITGEDRKYSPDEISRLISDLQRFNYKLNFRQSKILETKSLNFILENEADCSIYLHYTKEERDAQNILREGFRFVDSFYRTAFTVSDDRLDLLMKHNDKKFYGDYVIVICIANKLVEMYNSELEKAGIKNYSFENILTETPPVKNENADLVYLLPLKFIKGYINHRTGDIITNPGFYPGFISPGFRNNIEKLISQGMQ